MRPYLSSQQTVCGGECDYNGFAFDHTEGERLARALGPKSVLMMCNHGVLVVGDYLSRLELPTFDGGGDVENYIATLERLAGLLGRTEHVVPGHDPLVLKRYPAPSRALEGIVARLDVEPVGG